jgi:4-hydroxybenzoate polyprenyltransferase
MSADGPTPRQPIPAGTVSAIRGRMQAPALTWVTRVVIGLGLLSAVLPDDAGVAVATAVVVAVVAVPLLRVLWLVHRWRQERDPRFVGLGLALLGVVAAGAALAALGVGS